MQNLAEHLNLQLELQDTWSKPARAEHPVKPLELSINVLNQLEGIYIRNGQCKDPLALEHLVCSHFYGIGWLQVYKYGFRII